MCCRWFRQLLAPALSATGGASGARYSREELRSRSSSSSCRQQIRDRQAHPTGPDRQQPLPRAATIIGLDTDHYSVRIPRIARTRAIRNSFLDATVDFIQWLKKSTSGRNPGQCNRHLRSSFNALSSRALSLLPHRAETTSVRYFPSLQWIKDR
jgi:hypothetical protein